jgi:hypothetical protein
MNEEQSMRDLIIELKVTLTHFTARVDEALTRNDSRVSSLEATMKEQNKELERRVQALEKWYWIAIGMATLANLLIPFIRDNVRIGG